MNGQRKKMMHLYNGIFYQLLNKEGHPVTCDNIDKPGGYYATWYKPEGRILHDSAYMRYLK